MTKEEIKRKRMQEIEHQPEPRYPDAMNGLIFREGNMFDCPDPAVRKKYGSATGRCMLSTYSCKQRKCRHLIKQEFCGAVRCGYKEERNHEQSNRTDSETAEREG